MDTIGAGCKPFHFFIKAYVQTIWPHAMLNVTDNMYTCQQYTDAVECAEQVRMETVDVDWTADEHASLVAKLAVDVASTAKECPEFKAYMTRGKQILDPLQLSTRNTLLTRLMDNINTSKSLHADVDLYLIVCLNNM
jgi:hypothetical protein